MCKIFLFFSISLILNFSELRIYVIFSFTSCDPFSFLYPEKLINEQSKLSISKTTSLKIKFNFLFN